MSLQSTKKKFEDDELQIFLACPNIVVYSNNHHFFTVNGEAIYSFVVSYKENNTENSKPVATGTDLKIQKELSPQDKKLYEKLRLWRNNKSKEENLPAYVFFNNRQLDEIVSLKPKTLKALGSIAGIGKAKIEAYGREILDIIIVCDAKSDNDTGNHGNHDKET